MNQQTNFRKMFTEHTGKVSDKWSFYLDEWDRLFGDYQRLPIHLFEIGIQNGGSLEIWAKYFSQAEKIVGCDIDEKCKELSYSDDRIHVVVIDANSDECEKAVLQIAPAYDIIIDDGSHMSNDIILSFARYFPKLKEGGIYVIEDLHASYWKDFEGGLHNPLTAVAFLKRLADIVNYEHWRNTKSRESLLEEFGNKYSIEFNNFDLARIHSIEFLNSLCVIKKVSPEKNKLGLRRIVGREEHVTSGIEIQNGTTIQDVPFSIPDDCELDVFSLISSTQSLSELALNLNAQLEEKTKKIEELENQVSEKIKQAEELETHLSEQVQQVLSLTGQLTQTQNELQVAHNDILNYVLSTSWIITRPLREINKVITRKMTG